jgi:hypothetical protein
MACTAAAGIFSLGYLIFQVPSNLAITKVGAPTWLGLLIFCWGIIAASTAAMKNKGSFYACKGSLSCIWQDPCDWLPEFVLVSHCRTGSPCGEAPPLLIQ